MIGTDKDYIDIMENINYVLFKKVIVRQADFKSTGE